MFEKLSDLLIKGMNMKDSFEQNSLKGIKAPKICYTAGGMLIYNDKVLLIKHKKLGIWLNPGGHVDEGELPHETAQREFFEETGVKVNAVDAWSLPGLGNNFSLQVDGKNDEITENFGQFQPNPISTNLHWVNKESYRLRLASNNKNRRFPTKVWKRGCEQHVGFFYMLKEISGVEFKQNTEETDGIAWFRLDGIDELETRENIRREIKMGFKLLGLYRS